MHSFFIYKIIRFHYETKIEKEPLWNKKWYLRENKHGPQNIFRTLHYRLYLFISVVFWRKAVIRDRLLYHFFILQEHFNSIWSISTVTIKLIIFWDFLMLEQIFFSPQAKQSVIISNKLVYTSCITSCKRRRT